MAGSGRVGSHQHGDTVVRIEALGGDGQLGQGELENLDVVIGVVRSRIARAQQLAKASPVASRKQANGEKP